MPTVLTFDVNETLLDLRALDPLFDEIFGDASLRPQWFASMLQLSFVGGLTDQYVTFTTAQQAALRMLAARTGRDLNSEDVDRVVESMRRLPPHPEVEDALARLRAGGYRMTALTNSVLDVARDQLVNAGLIELFDDVYSADEVRALKPAPAPYRMVAERCGVAVSDVCLVAAHVWDVSGALAAGGEAAFVARGGIVPSPIGRQPQYIGDDLDDVAAALLKPSKARTPQ